jgi:aspartate beta-hydroxylase
MTPRPAIGYAPRMSATIEQLVQAANRSANAGAWQEAERLWGEVYKLDPRHLQALYALGVHAFKRGDLPRSLEFLTAARVAAPNDRLIHLTLSRVHRQRGASAAEREAIDAALAVDAYYLPALLAKANWIERHGPAAAAAASYANALKVAPPESHWPAALKRELEHARTVTERHSRAFHAHLTETLAQLQSELPSPAAGRWREAAAIMAGRSRPYLSVCNQLYVPRVPAIPFHDRAEFPWVPALEAKTDAIRDELMTVLADDRDRFSPYIAYRPGEPVNQWKELNHSQRWSAFHLWRDGAPVEENLKRCPVTAATLEALPMAEIDGLCPNAIFSALAPKTVIPPHHGETNARLIVHLPLVVPDGCRYRVGFEERAWTVGEVLIFDDTIEHEARNDSDELRVVLIFDIWNPLLSASELAMAGAMARAARDFATRG